MDPTLPPIAPVPLVTVPPADPGIFGGAAALVGGAMLLGFLLWAGIVFLGILGCYWLIRLAVRHGLQDHSRWQATGSVKKAKGRKVRPVRPWDPPPRGPRDW